jgi:outer membrane protein TolC
MGHALHSVLPFVTRARRGLRRAGARITVAAIAWSWLSAIAAAQPAATPAQPGQPAPVTPPVTPAAVPTAPAPSAVPADTGEQRPMQFVLDALQEGVDPMSADDAAAIAVKSAPSVARSAAASDQAREAASQSLVAVYPRLDLVGQYTHFSKVGPIRFRAESTSGGMPIEFEVTPPLLDQYLLQAKVSYPVSDLFFSILPRYKAAKRAVEAQQYNTAAEGNTVALNTREAFYNYARARAALLVARSSQAQTEAQLKDVASLVAAGTVARVEQMRAEANVASSRVAVARAEGAVAIARNALRTLLHRPGDQDIAMTEDFAQVLPPLADTKEQLLEAAIKQRSELRSLSIMLDVHDRNIRANDGDKLPKLGVSAVGDLGNPNQRSTSFERKWVGTWAVIGTLSWSPNDFAVADARADQVGAQRAQTLADIAALEDALRSEVSQAVEDYSAAQQAVDAAATGIRAAEETYRVRREQFRAGAAVATDVVIAESDLNRARLELVNAAIDLRIARARLDHALERNTPKG